MSNGKNIFLTGITGFLGSFLAVELLKKGHKIYALARGKGNKSAKERVYDALKFAFYEDEWDVESGSKNVEVIQGDIVQDDLGIAPSKWNELVEIIDFIFHSAALTELNVPIEVIRKPNVEGTRHVLNFALECQEKGRLRKFNHISTVYVCGDHEGEFDETMLDVGQSFNNAYEQSKFEAELLVRDYQKKALNISVFRPSLIIGESQEGRTNSFQHIYKFLRLLSLKILDVYPIDIESWQNLVNVDSVSKSIVALSDKEEKLVFHTINPVDICLDTFIRLSCDFFNLRMPNFIAYRNFDFDKISSVQKALIMPVIPYLNCKTKFKSEKTQKALKKYDLILPKLDKECLLRMFEYCFLAGYIKSNSN